MIELPYMIRNAKFTLYGTARKHYISAFMKSNKWYYIILEQDITLDNGQKCLKDAHLLFHESYFSDIHYYSDTSMLLDNFELDAPKSVIKESTGILMADLYEMNEKNWFEYKINEALDSKDEEAFNKLMNYKLPNGLDVCTLFMNTSDGVAINLCGMEVNIK